MAQAFEGEGVQEVLPPKRDGDDDHGRVEVGDADERDDHARVRGRLVGALGECHIYICVSYILIVSTLQQNSGVNG